MNKLFGLENLGNTCYINSIIQVFLNTPSLVHYIKTQQYVDDVNETKNEKEILFNFNKLIDGISKCSNNQVVVPKTFISTLYKYNDDLIGTQQDCCEFYNYLLNTFHETIAQKTIFKMKNKSNSYISKLSLNAWNKFFSKEYSVFIKYFYGQLRTTIKCLKCNNKSYIFEPYSNLSLPIDDCETLQECLDFYMKEELLCDNNKYYCGNCAEKNDATKKINIQYLPKYLTIQLKRFNNIGDKLDKIINYPEELTLIEQNTKKSKYELYCVINHSGILHGGHYYTICKNNNKWYNLNDEYINEVENYHSDNAYMLFYKKIN